MKTPKHIKELIKDGRNANKHSDKGMQMLKDGIIKNGLGRSILLSADNEIIAGNGVTEAAEKIGIEKIKVIETDGTEIIAVKRTDIKSGTREFYEMALSDNIIAKENIIMDAEVVDAICEDYGIEEYKTQKDEAEAQEDDYEIPDEIKTDIVLGDLFEIGSHRLLCGDSTDSDQVSKLMGGGKADMVCTDPPYNTGMQGKKNNEKARLFHMFNDSFPDKEWADFLTATFNNYNLFTKGECALYIFIDWRRLAEIKQAAESIADVKNIIVWDKGVHGLGSDYKSTYENCVVAKKGKPEINNRFGLDYQDIWRVQRTIGRVKEHATQKPIELLSKPIKHASKQDDIVLDLFLGSGSTMVAAHQLNRKCYGMELEPKYCQVIVDRMITLDPGIEIKRNGKPYEPKPKT